jgi:hypothetical protein
MTVAFDPRTIVALDPVAVFRARAEARALLWRIGEFDLHEAVDKLQADAVESGLDDEIGQNEMQEIISSAFRVVREGAW